MERRVSARLAALLAILVAAAIAAHAVSAWALAPAIPVKPSVHGIVLYAALSVSLVYCVLVRQNAAAATLAGVLLAGMLGLTFATEMGYAVHFIGRGFPLADPVLLEFDRALGFDSMAFLAWFDDHPVAAAVLRFCYENCGLQLVLLVLVLGARGDHDRIIVFMTANMLALIAFHLIAIRFPALGAHGFLQVLPSDHPHIALSPMADTVRDVLRVRSATALAIPDTPLGLITFPSYHMAASCLFAWGFWRSGVLRWPVLLFNLLVAASALLDGGHYLVDLIAGTASAAILLLLVSHAGDAGAGLVEKWRRATPARNAGIAATGGGLVPG